MKKILRKSKEKELLSDVIIELIITSLILGFLINCIWWYYKFTMYLHSNIISDYSFFDWILRDNYKIFENGSFAISFIISVGSTLLLLTMIWIIMKKSDKDVSEIIEKEDFKEIQIESKIQLDMESKEEENNFVEVSDMPFIDKEEDKNKEKDEVIEDIFATSEQTEIEIQKPKLKDVITEKVENEVESIEKIEKDFERCNLLFIKRIYGKRVHRRKIMELESKVDRLKSLGKVSEDYNLY
ncbi:MAG: hypothetical protein HN427_00720 [Flavobacteriales bacterium]|jgi:hypothetical protein|nr:hypothetical protein [Flavobacteriales bacterium]MBT6013339.1 hypothetical protein [Flavobacteriales bacterium]